MTRNIRNGRADGEAQLKWHRMHLGLYARVAKRPRVNPSYVSRVPRGKLRSDEVKKALLQELARISQLNPERVSSRRMSRSV